MSLITSTLSAVTRSLHLGSILRQFSQGAVACSNKPRPPTESLIQWNKLNKPNKPRKDRWDEKHALFGENDYKDILGDGSYLLKNNVKSGPMWLRGWRGNELQILTRKKKVMGADMGPTKRYALLKRIKYLHKRMNRNHGRWKYIDRKVPNYRDNM